MTAAAAPLLGRPEPASGDGAAATPGPVIDAHVHVVDDAGSLGPFASMGRPEKLLQEMDRAGVDSAVMLPVVTERTPDNNERCARHARRFADRLTTLTDVPLHAPDAATQVAEARERYGAVGVSYYPSRPDLSWLTAPAREPLWEAFSASGLVCNLQVTPAGYPALLTLCRRYPAIPFVCNHLGLPGRRSDDDISFGGLLEGATSMNLFVKASGFYACANDPWDVRDARALALFGRLLQSFGAERILWGSDWPPVGWHLTYRQSLEIVRSAAGGLGDADRRLILGANAARVYLT